MPAAAAPAAAAAAVAAPAPAAVSTQTPTAADDYATILAHIPGIKDLPPLDIQHDVHTDTAVMKPLNPVDAAAVLQKTQTYICGINLMWIDPLKTATPAVPTDRARIMSLSSVLFPKAEPEYIKELTHIRLADANDDIVGQKGNLALVGPEDILHATLFAATTNLTSANPKAAKWALILRSAPCCIHVIPNTINVYWENFRLRQKLIATVDACRRTPLQMATEVKMAQRMMESETGSKPSAKDISTAFNTKGGKVAQTCDDITENYVTTALLLFERIAQFPDITAPILALERALGPKKLS